jgi:hypothetical protein
MEDYEIRDALRRATTPALEVQLSLGSFNTAKLEFAPRQEISKPVTLHASIANLSPQPAYHALVYLGIDAALGTIVGIGGLTTVSAPIAHGDSAKHWLLEKVQAPPGMPIFREGTPLRLAVNFTVPSQCLRSSLFGLLAVVQAPGHSSTDHWAMACSSGLLKLYGPNDPQWMPRA